MTIPAFGWHDNSPPNISAANLEAMHLAGGAYTDQKTGYFSVKDPTFGAKGDGTTDDTAAIQTAINQAAANSSRGGAVVYLPSGTYLISSALLVYFGVHLICASSLSTTIRASATAPLSNFQNGNNAPGGGPRPDYTGTHVVPALIRWDGNDKWAHGVRITGVTLDTNGIPGLSGMWIEDTGEGSWFDDVSCSSCVATNRTVSNGQLVAGSNNVTLTHVPTLVSSGTASGGSTQAATLNTTGATLLVVTIGTVTNPPTVSDSLGNAWTVIGGNATFMAYAWQKSGGGALVTGATHTITVTSSVGSVWFGAYSNTQTAADPLDASYESYTGGSGVSPQAVTPTQGYDFAVTMFGSSDGPFTTVSVDSGFNIVYTSDWISGTHYSNATATKIATDTSPIKPTWTPSTTADFSIATAVFKAAPVSDTFTEEDVNAILSFGGSVPAPASPTLTAHYQLSPPGAPVPTTATTGGTVAAGIYTVATTFVNVLGETVASAQGTITTTGATSTITVPFPASPPADATGWYAYVSQAGGSTLTRQQAAGSPTGVATNFVLTAPPTSTGAAPPVTNTTGGSLTSGTTYTVGLTYLTANGETAISVATPPAPPQPSITPSGTNPYITVTTPGAPAGGGATGWFAYVTHDGNLPLQRSQAPGSATAVGTNYQLTSYPASGAATPYQKIDRIDWAANSHDTLHNTAIMRNPAVATLSNISFTVARPTDAFVIQNIGTPGNVGQLHGVTNSGAVLRTRGGSGDIKQLSGDDNVGGMFRWSGGAWGADMALINIHSIKAESDTYNANWQYSMDPVILLDRCFTVALNVYGGTYIGGAYTRDVVRLDNNFISTQAPSPSVLLVGVEGQNWYNPQYANIIHDSSTGGAIASSDYSSSPAYPVILWNRKLKLGGGAMSAGKLPLPPPTGNATTDVANLNAAITRAGNAGTIVGAAGTYQLNAQITIPSGVNLECAGSAQGGDTHSTTVFQCTTAVAGLWFKGDGSTSGNFIIDGNNVATQPFLRGDSSAGSQRQFQSVVVRASAQDNMTIQYSQNDTYINCVCSSPARDNLVLDAGTGGHIFINHENAGHGRYGIHLQQTVNTAATFYSVPAQTQFFGGRTEGGTSATGAALQIDNGYHITFENHDLNHGTGAVSAIANVITASTALGQVNTGNIVFRDVWTTGGAATSHGIHVDGVSNITIDGGEFGMTQGALDLASGAGLFIVRLPFVFGGPTFSSATPISAIVGVTPPGLSDLSWKTPTLQNSWTNLGSSYSTTAYRKDGQGYVHLKGVLSGGTTTLGTVVFTLPVGYIPAENKVYAIVANGAVGEVRIFGTASGATAGQVQIQTWPTGGTYLTLDSVSPFLAAG